MTDLHYKFPTEAAMLAALRAIDMTFTDEGGVERVYLGGHRYAAWVVGECKLPNIDFTNTEFFERIPPQAQFRIRLKKPSPQFAPWEVGTDVASNIAQAVHLNVRVVDPTLDLSSLEQFRLTPHTPDNVWA